MSMSMRLEAIVIPVTDVDRARDFYVQAGFLLDVDHDGGTFRVVQVTSPGSPCSAILMHEPDRAGQVLGLHLVVSDIEVVHSELRDRGVEVGGFFHYAPDGARLPGLDPRRSRFGSYAEFVDPDGNGWVLQEVPPEEPS